MKVDASATNEALRCRFQLVVTTLGRMPELERLLCSIADQTVSDVHVVVVDQSAGNQVGALSARYAEHVRLTHVRSASGASRGRNAGARLVRPEPGADRLVAFPDDDCWYPQTLLTDVGRVLDAHPEWDGCTGRSIAADGSPSTARWDHSGGRVTRENVWSRGVAFTIFARERLVAKVGAFDETLGPGAGTEYGAGEETDYLLRALDHGLVVGYDPALVVYHPDKLGTLDAEAYAKSRRYGAGIGRVLRKNGYGPAFIAYICARPLGGAALALARGRPARARYHWESAVGRVLGALSR
jgi:GT2 family glycosyltransferase